MTKLATDFQAIMWPMSWYYYKLPLLIVPKQTNVAFLERCVSDLVVKELLI